MRRIRLLLVTITIIFICAQTQDATPPDTWQEHWFEHNQLVKLQTYDDNVALYYDGDMDKSITWPFDITSQIWAYTKATYGDFGGQQRLFTVLHANKYGGGHPSTFFDESHDYRNTIDIGQDGSWADESGWNLDVVTHEIAHIVEFASKNVHNSPAFGIWGDSKWAEIYIYDVYNKLGWTDQLERVVNDMNGSSGDDFPRPGTFWFKNWFFPIYRDYGETSALNRYFQLLSNNFPKTTLDGTYFQYNRDLNLGEFVYFWSGAAQADLKDLALSAFGDKDKQGNDWGSQYEQAKIDFPNIFNPVQTPPETWQEHWFEHNQLVKLQAYDDNIALYYDDNMDKSITWPKDRMSQAWDYTKQVYGDFGGDRQRLFVLLHQNKYGGGHPSTYFDESHDFRNVIDVGQGEGGSWQDDSGWNIAVLVHEISHIVELASKNVHNSPAFGIWGDSKWAEIFIYDVFNKLGWTDDANAWMDDRNNAGPDDFPREGTFWWRDWFYPIYRDHGETDALNRYFQLLSDNFPKHPLDDTHFEYDRDMNLGEFVWFWSGAAQTDLKDMAMTAFGDKDKDGNDWNAQYEQAKQDFLNVFNPEQSELATDDAQSDPLNINIDIVDNPDGAPNYPQQAQDLVPQWDPFITQLLATDGFASPRDVTFKFQKGLDAPAFTAGDTISVNVDYINGHADDLGMMIHEYTHVVQQYPANQFGEDAGWLTEGIADYVRYIYYEPNHDNPNDPPATDSWFQQNQPKPTDTYKSGYGNASRFIYWIGQKFSISDLLQQLNQKMRDGSYQSQIFQDLTGQSVDDLWNTYTDELGVPNLHV